MTATNTRNPVDEIKFTGNDERDLVETLLRRAREEEAMVVLKIEVSASEGEEDRSSTDESRRGRTLAV